MTDRASFNRICTCVAVSAAAVLLSLQLLVPPIVGLANEGDFERVMGYAGLFYPTDKFEEKYYGHIVTKFNVVAPGWYASGYLTTETLVAYSARLVSLALFPGRMFDIRIFAAIQMLLLLTALGLFVRACRDLAPAAQAAVAVLLVLIFTDVGYAAAINSFYPQTASLLFILLTLAFAAVGIRMVRLRGPAVVGYFVSAALLVCSKPQEAIHAPLLGGLGVILAIAGQSETGSSRRVVVAIALAVALGALGLWYYRQVPKVSIRYVGLFHTVFHELLQNSPDPRRDMEELGIAPDLDRYIGVHAYMKESPIEDPAFQARFFDHFGYAKVMGFYLRHPDRLLDRLRRAAPGAFRLRPKYLGNFEKATGVAPRTKATRFALWSDVRAKLERHAAVTLVVFFVGNLLAAALSWRGTTMRGRLFLVALVACLLIAGVEFGVNAFADALDDLGRHLFVFDALCDLVLVADVAWLIQWLATRRALSPRSA